MSKGNTSRVSVPRPLTVALFYMVFAGGWIILSGYLLFYAVEDSALQLRLELAKGLVFVLLTGIFLYFFLQRTPIPVDTLSAQVEAERSGGRWRLPALVTVLILVVPVIGLGILRMAIPDAERNAWSNLEAVAKLQADSIDIWRQSHLRDLEIVAQSPRFLEPLVALGEGADDREAKEALKSLLNQVFTAFGLTAIAVLDNAGRPLATLGDPVAWRPGQGLSGSRGDSGAGHSTALFLDDTGEPAAEFVVPIDAKTGGGSFRGYLVFVAGPGQQVFRNMSDLPGDLETLETMLVKFDGDQAIGIHLTRRNSSDHSLIRRPLAEDELFTKLAAGKSSGRFRAVDHHGEEVLAIQLPEPVGGWTLVAKMDLDEALAPVRQLAAWVTLIAFAALSTISLVLMLLWRQQRRAHALAVVAQHADYERQLRRQEGVYRDMFQSNPNPMMVFDNETLRFLEVNDVAVKKYGYSRDEFFSLTLEDIRPPEDLPAFRSWRERETPEDFEVPGVWRHVLRDGRIIEVEITSHPLVFEGHEARIALVHDVTEREKSSRRLAESERFAYSTIDSLAMNLAVLDERGDIIATNRRWREFAAENNAAPAVTGAGVNYLEVCRKAADTDADAAEVLRGLEAIMAGNTKEFSHEYPCHSPTKQRWFAVHLSRFPDDGPLRVVVVHEDVTDRKLAEGELRVLNRHYAALSAMNAAIIRAESPDQVIDKVCRIAAEQGELLLVTVGRIGDSGSMEFLASHGPAEGCLDILPQISASANAMELVPAREAVRTGKMLNVEDLSTNPRTAPWAELAAKWDLRAMLVCPIVGRQQTWGFIAFLADQAGYFRPKLRALLEELTADLAYSLDVLESERLRRETEAELLLNARVIESSHEGIFIADETGRMTMVNAAMCEITGYGQDELLGRHPADLLPGDEASAETARDVSRGLAENGRWEGEIWNRRKNGEVFPVWISATSVEEPESEKRRQIIIYRDITSRKEYESRIEHLASHDILTDLPNRVMLRDLCRQALARAERQQHRLALLFIDLDRFKLINDTLGHDIGDRLLKTVAARIVAVLRQSDVVSRVGGDEFVAIIEVREPRDAALVAQKIISEIGKPCDVDGHQLVVTASLGIALYPDNGADFEGLSRLADHAMISAKQAGQDQYHFYSGQMGVDAGEYLEIQNALRDAIRQEKLYAVFQPQVDLSDGRIIGIEALARWDDPRLGSVSPGRFIPIAEDSGMIIQLGRLIMEKACRQLKFWQDHGILDVPVSVNVSALQFRQINFVETVAEVLEVTGLASASLELEVTESVLMTNFAETLDKMNRISRLGTNLAIDDFGTGYSSLAYLRKFPAKRLKIDMSFILDLPENPDAQAIARAIVSLGNTLNMEVIAEGVETAEQADFLASIWCRQAQGYFFAKPMAAGDLESWLKNWKGFR